MLTIDNLIQQVEASKRAHEQAKAMFEDGTMALHLNNVKVSPAESAAKEALFIERDEQLIAELQRLKNRYGN